MLVRMSGMQGVVYAMLVFHSISEFTCMYVRITAFFTIIYSFILAV